MIIIEGIQNFLSPTSRGSIRRAHRKAKFHRGDPIFLANNCLTRVSTRAIYANSFITNKPFQPYSLVYICIRHHTLESSSTSLIKLLLIKR